MVTKGLDYREGERRDGSILEKDVVH